MDLYNRLPKEIWNFVEWNNNLVPHPAYEMSNFHQSPSTPNLIRVHQHQSCVHIRVVVKKQLKNTHPVFFIKANLKKPNKTHQKTHSLLLLWKIY